MTCAPSGMKGRIIETPPGGETAMVARPTRCSCCLTLSSWKATDCVRPGESGGAGWTRYVRPGQGGGGGAGAGEGKGGGEDSTGRVLPSPRQRPSQLLRR
eukprot:scaffold17116_cov67-Phaeocystis_antarctica.AAC.5